MMQDVTLALLDVLDDPHAVGTVVLTMDSKRMLSFPRILFLYFVTRKQKILRGVGEMAPWLRAVSLVRGPRLGFQHPVGQLTAIISNSNCKGSNTLCLPLQAPGTHVVGITTCREIILPLARF